MPPATSCSANATLTAFAPGDAQIPSDVPRTDTFTGSPPLFDLAMKSHIACVKSTWQPIEFCIRVSMVGLHLELIFTSVAGFEKSSSNWVLPVPGMNCTVITFMLGGRSTPSSG